MRSERDTEGSGEISEEWKTGREQEKLGWREEKKEEGERGITGIRGLDE